MDKEYLAQVRYLMIAKSTKLPKGRNPYSKKQSYKNVKTALILISVGLLFIIVALIHMIGYF